MDIQIQITSQMDSEYVERNNSTQKHGYTVNQSRVCETGFIFIRCKNERDAIFKSLQHKRRRFEPPSSKEQLSLKISRHRLTGIIHETRDRGREKSVFKRI